MMWSIAISDTRTGTRRIETFDQNEVTIGRVKGNDVLLPHGTISMRHSRVVLRDEKLIVVDLKSANGTFVDGQRIDAPSKAKRCRVPTPPR
jgi:pilus assembly protein CpaF